MVAGLELNNQLIVQIAGMVFCLLSNFTTSIFEHQISNLIIWFQLSSNKCSARTMDEDVTRLTIHSEEPKIIIHGSGKYKI